MQWQKNLRLSFVALYRSPWRTLLSSSAIAIGIASVVALLGVGIGAEKAFRQTLEAMGKNRISITAALLPDDAPRGAGRPVETLTAEDGRALVEQSSSVERVSPILMRNFEVRRKGRALISTVIGTTGDFLHTTNQQLAHGRFLDSEDEIDSARVAVLGALVAQQLFPEQLPGADPGAGAVGRRVQVDGLPFIVIGVLKAKGTDPTGSDEDNRILIPIRTAQRRLMGVEHVDRLIARATSEPALPRAQEEIRTLLRARHGQSAGEEDDFTIVDQKAQLELLRETDRSFSRLLGGLAALTLGLASIGLSAISLLSVRERRGEIGLRLAVGARPRHVLGQFLAETLIIALIGALGGLFVGGTGIILGSELLGWSAAIGWAVVVYPLLLSVAIAIVFGTYPALRAARLDPIRALTDR